MDDKRTANDLVSHFEKIFDLLYYNNYDAPYSGTGWREDPNLINSPMRIARAWLEMTRGIREELPEEFKTIFPCKSNNMVVVKNLEFAGVCPHHFLPVEYKCDIAYLPHGWALGLSKFHRIASHIATVPMLQEEIGECIAKAIASCVYKEASENYYGGAGIIIHMVGSHSCMRVRGTKSPNSSVSTTTIYGKAFEKDDLKQEFYNSLRRN